MGMGGTISDIPHLTGTSPSEVWDFSVFNKGPENVGLSKDTKVRVGIIPASWVLGNPLALPTGASLCILQPQGR